MSSSWKTTLCGILSIAAAAITLVVLPLVDADPLTLPNYTAFVAALTAGVGLMYARDNDKTSAAVGATTKL
jgi:hypothetical protein